MDLLQVDPSMAIGPKLIELILVEKVICILIIKYLNSIN